jgi:hypothetical protein
MTASSARARGDGSTQAQTKIPRRLLEADIVLPVVVPALCQGCKRKGPVTLGEVGRPLWCLCDGPVGPYVAPPGHVTMFRCETREEAAHRAQGRLLGNAEREARDRLSAASWTRYTRDGRTLSRSVPTSNPARRRAARAYGKALRALETFQRACAHEFRNSYQPTVCDHCHVVVEVPVHQHDNFRKGREAFRHFFGASYQRRRRHRGGR